MKAQNSSGWVRTCFDLSLIKWILTWPGFTWNQNFIIKCDLTDLEKFGKIRFRLSTFIKLPNLNLNCQVMLIRKWSALSVFRNFFYNDLCPAFENAYDENILKASSRASYSHTPNMGWKSTTFSQKEKLPLKRPSSCSVDVKRKLLFELHVRVQLMESYYPPHYVQQSLRSFRKSLIPGDIEQIFA